MSQVRLYVDPDKGEEPISVKAVEEGFGVTLVVVNPKTGKAVPNGRILRVERCGIYVYARNHGIGLPTDSTGCVRVLKEGSCGE